jgi:iron-sulfur cluster repair protein YtfE (RIC family)
MNIEKFKHQHRDILGNISALRRLAQAGVAQNAADIAELIVSMSSTIKLHLAVEDQALYPALQRGANAELARMGQQYQKDMGPIAQAYDAFAKRWNRPESVRRDEQSFRDDANRVLRMVFDRMQRENRDFYPRIEGA